MFIDLRITPKFIPGYADCPEEWPIATWFSTLKEYFKPQRWIIGVEDRDKYGESKDCHLHYHINMGECDIDVDKASMQKWIRNNIHAKGPRSYCLRPWGDLDDEARWWRYPLKQKGIKSHGFTKDELRDMTMLAKDEYSQTAARNIKTRAKLENKSQFRDKLHKYLKTEHTDERNTKKLYVLIAKYYQDQGNVPPTSKLYDCVIDYLTIIGHLSWEDHFERHHHIV